MLVLGSRARGKDRRPADEFSDLDLLIFARDPATYIEKAGWLYEIAPVVLTFLERSVAGHFERRVLFTQGLDVDFNFLPSNFIHQLHRKTESRVPPPEDFLAISELLAGVLQRGYRIVFDKDGFLADFISSLPAPTPPTLPNEKMLRNDIDDFWYHALWTAKKLRRGELLTAKECLDGYMKDLFFRMVRTLARAAKGPDYDTWHQVRFFEEWADGETLEALPLLYARYDATDMARALEATMAQYSRVARKACELLGYSYPAESEETIKTLVEKVLKVKG